MRENDSLKFICPQAKAARKVARGNVSGSEDNISNASGSENNKTGRPLLTLPSYHPMDVDILNLPRDSCASIAMTSLCLS